MKPLRRRLRGFTLVELMIVVAIISILASLAIPQFLAFRSKAMQSEVKANFSGFHRAQVAYYAENNGYTDNIRELAWRPVGQPRYLYGFTSDAIPAASGTNDTAELAAVMTGFEYSTTGMVSGDGIPLTDADLPSGSVASAGGYRFGAVANIDPDPALDRWELTEANLFTHLENDAR